MVILNTSQLSWAKARRSVHYEIEFGVDEWRLMAIDPQEQKYLICTYDDEQNAERVCSYLNKMRELS